VAVLRPPWHQLQKKAHARPSGIDLTWPRRVPNGLTTKLSSTPRGVWSSSTRPAPPPTWLGSADERRAVNGYPHGHWKTHLGSRPAIDRAHRARRHRRPDERQRVPGLVRASPRAQPDARRHRRDGQSQKVPGVCDAIEAIGARLLYLPPYSPDFNPIEQLFARPCSAEPPSARGRSLEPHRAPSRCLHTLGMHQLLPQCRICSIMGGNCSSGI
jgi:hypothetical protein